MKRRGHFLSANDGNARAALRFVGAALMCVTLSAVAMAVGLNDTGFTTCADASGATVSCTAATAVQGQDARYGRDAAAGTGALTKVGGGANGFDFTKISNAGNPLLATAPLGTAAGEWGCTYDNTTGLMWEVKTTSGLRAHPYVYSWYSTDSSSNGGAVGTAGAGGCFDPLRCDTQAYVQDINAASMCGHNDWRLPTVRELFGVTRAGNVIDSGYFPQPYYAPSPLYWSGSTYAANSDSAYIVSFYSSGIGLKSKTQGNSNNPVYAYVRVVRVGR